MNILINVYDYYITPDEYAEAERNGIRARQVEHRIRDYAWRKKKAITKPTQVKIYRSHMNPVVLDHGISNKQFLDRIHKGWDEWRAATAPLRDSEAFDNRLLS